MSDTATRPHESRETGTHNRGPLTWLVAAAAVVLIAAAGVFGLAQRDDGTRPTVQHSVTALRYDGARAMCIVPNTSVLRAQSVAFRGTLASMRGRTATFAVDHWYVGGPTDTATVTVAPRRSISELVRAADLEVGHDYLVAASEGNVTGCGYTGPARGDLQRLYDRAFG